MPASVRGNARNLQGRRGGKEKTRVPPAEKAASQNRGRKNRRGHLAYEITIVSSEKGIGNFPASEGGKRIEGCRKA